MPEIKMTILDETLASLAATPDDASAEIRMLAAAKLFELQKLSFGAAAELAGISRVEFIKRPADCGAAYFDLAEEEFEQERRAG